jgi:hypothetical protein
MTETDKGRFDIGIPYTDSKDAHLTAYYQLRTQMGALIVSGGTAQQIRAMTEYIISHIPSQQQGNLCVELLQRKTREEVESLMKERKIDKETQDILETATISACMCVLRAVSEIMDEDLGIRKRVTIGVI